MSKITYTPGRYCQLKLSDGTRVFVHTRPMAIKVSRMLFGVIPTTALWKFSLPFFIRRGGPACSVATEMLDLVIESIEDCNTVHELTTNLSERTTTLLNNYLTKLGDLAKDVREGDVVRDYGALLERLGSQSNSQMLQPESLLRHPKEEIRNALQNSITATKDKNMKASLRACLSFLDDFVPDAEVPSDSSENIVAWAERRERLKQQPKRASHLKKKLKSQQK